MRKIIIVLIIFGIFSISTFSQGKSNRPAETLTYNSCGEDSEIETIPCFMQDLNCISKREIRKYAKQMQISAKEFSYNNCIIVSSKMMDDNLIEKTIIFEDARKNAWVNARKHAFDSYIDQFVVQANEGGNTVIDKKSFTESFYKLMTKYVDGVSPLTVLKQVPVFDKCPKEKGYHCYMLVYLRKDELYERMRKLKDEAEFKQTNRYLKTRSNKQDSIIYVLENKLDSFNNCKLELDRKNKIIKKYKKDEESIKILVEIFETRNKILFDGRYLPINEADSFRKLLIEIERICDKTNLNNIEIRASFVLSFLNEEQFESFLTQKIKKMCLDFIDFTNEQI